MCTVHARIKKYKNSTTAHVIFRIKDGKTIDINYTSEILVDSDKWDNDSEGYPRKVILTDPQKEEVNQLILSRLRLVQQVYETQKYLIEKPTTRWITEEVNKALFVQQQNTTSENNLIESFQDFIENFVLNKNRKYHFYTVLNSFKRFISYLSIQDKGSVSLKFSNINYDILTRYRLFLVKEHNICIKYSIETERPISKARKNSTINGYLKKLRTFLYHYKNVNQESHNPFERFQIESDNFGTPLHLSIQEFEYLQKVCVDNPRLDRIRDIFVLNCLLGFRVSDLFNMKHTDIVNGRIEYYPSKTKEYEILVKVPLKASLF